MKLCKKAILWLWLLTKRLYKRPAFLAILILIPALVLSYTAMTRNDSSVLTVALVQGNDPAAQQVTDRLYSGGQMIRYLPCDTDDDAEELVLTGKADMAWILPNDLTQRIETFIENPGPRNSFVLVYLREDTVSTTLARERLTGALYEQIAQRYYISYMRKNFPELEHLSDLQLMEYYDRFDFEQELFIIEDAFSSTETPQQVHYLLSPVRGLLAVLVVLCGLAAAMFHIRDMERGTFNWVSLRLRPGAELVSQLTSVGNVSTVAFFTLLCTGMATAPVKEILILLLYALCVVSFCMVLRRLLGSIRILGVLTPLLIVVMLLVCPVFFDFRGLRTLQFLLPPTYYINAPYKPVYLLCMPLYTLANGGIYMLLGKIFRNR